MIETFLVWMFIGFLAQLIDGALGMAYGVSATTILVTIGVYPALASASVHTAEVFTTLVSGSAHFKLGNVDRRTTLCLLIPGIVGGVTGAYVCSEVSGKPLSIIVGFVLLSMGFLILYKFAFRTTLQVWKETTSLKILVPLGYVAAFLDALGGGGWGPVTTTTLVANNVKPSKAIGSVNFAEFFVTIFESITFFILIGWENFNWLIVLGLLVGGVICAPIAAWICRKMPTRILGILVGVTVIVLSIRTILTFVGLI